MRCRWSWPPGSKRLMPPSSRMLRVFCSCRDLSGLAPCREGSTRGECAASDWGIAGYLVACQCLQGS